MDRRVLNCFMALLVTAIFSFNLKAQEGVPNSDPFIASDQVQRSENLLPDSTRMWVSVPDADMLTQAFKSTRLGELSQNEELKPFVEKLTKQVKDWLDDKNFEFGIKTDQMESVQSGEICIAAVLPNAAITTDYGFVLMIDIHETKDKAEELLASLGEELKRRDAEDTPIELEGVSVTKWKYPKPKGIHRRQKFAYHLLTDQWLVVCDNENILRDLIGRLNSTNSEKSLATLAEFQKIRKECAFTGIETDPQITWFLEPFGYFDILRDIADQNRKALEMTNDYSQHLRKTGFGAIKGLGGNVAFGGQHEIILRSYVYAPANDPNPERRFVGSAEILDFENRRKHDLLPETFIPENASSYLTISWNMKKAFDNVQPLFDAIVNENAFESMVENLRTDVEGPMVDLEELVGLLDDRISVFTENIPPVDESSEKIAIAVRIAERGDDVFDMVRRMIPQAETIKDGEFTYLVDDETKSTEEETPWDIPDEEEEEENENEPKPLFDKKIYVTCQNYLLVGNDLDYVKKIVADLDNNPGMKLRSSVDFQVIDREMSQFVDADRVSLRQFFRLDDSVRVNYEMMRQGKMGSSNTLLAKILNQALTPDGSPDNSIRQQQVDGSDLPDDFEKSIAPYLGSGGITMETESTGWIITGILMPKTSRSDVASKENEEFAKRQ